MSILPIVRYYNPTLEITVAGTKVLFRDARGLSIRFRVTRSTAPSPDTAEVAVVGLDPVRAKQMTSLFATSGTATLTVRAGYDGVLGGLFRGDVRTLASSDRNGPETITRVTADDGGDSISDTPIRITNAGMTAAQMIAVAAAAMGLGQAPSVGAVLAASDPSKQGPYTAVMTGKASDLLDAACRRIRARWWVRDGLVHLGRRGFVDVTRPAVLVTDETLVEEPSQDGSGLSSMTVLFDPRIVPGGQVAYRGTHLRAESVVYSGETRGAAVWTTRLVGRAL